MVKEDALTPRLLVVTVLAGISLGTLVGVVFLMANTTVGRGLNVKDRLDMTGTAFNTGMRTAEGMLRVDIMIEGRLRPRVRNMTGVAALAKMTVVVVIVSVAGEAGGAQLVGKWVFAMAVAAREHCVFPGQIE